MAKAEAEEYASIPPGSRREKMAYDTLKALWPPRRLLDQEVRAIRKFLLKEYEYGTNGKAKQSIADITAARTAITVISRISLCSPC